MWIVQTNHGTIEIISTAVRQEDGELIFVTARGNLIKESEILSKKKSKPKASKKIVKRRHVKFVDAEKRMANPNVSKPLHKSTETFGVIWPKKN